MADIAINDLARDLIMYSVYENYVRRNGNPPKIIIVNPEFWQILIQIYKDTYIVRNSEELKFITFNGIEVLRSKDLQFKDVRMY